MISGYIDHNINIIILDKLFDRFLEIKGGDEIKLRIVIIEILFQPIPFLF